MFDWWYITIRLWLVTEKIRSFPRLRLKLTKVKNYESWCLIIDLGQTCLNFFHIIDISFFVYKKLRVVAVLIAEKIHKNIGLYVFLFKN